MEAWTISKSTTIYVYVFRVAYTYQDRSIGAQREHDSIECSYMH